MIATYVQEGSEYENGCLSSLTRDDLLCEERMDETLFDHAKVEVLNDIWMNPSLKSLIEKEVLSLETSSSFTMNSPAMKKVW